VLLGVTGGIAAYKGADLANNLVKRGHEVRVVMTPSATRFVGEITFEALSGHPVMTDALATGGTTDDLSSVRHIAWAKWAEVAAPSPHVDASGWPRHRRVIGRAREQSVTEREENTPLRGVFSQSNSW
ncbi:MAG: flavoprotein, partial [Candidatus Methylomirabilales bacterium]